MEITDMNQCSGCGACVACCPVNAIKFIEDRHRRRTPEIDPERCIECGLCVKTCPINHGGFLSEQESEKCYALRAKDKGKISGCSSGGVATVISGHIIEQGGHVFGCRFNEAAELLFTECSTEEELETIKGSKYVQSNLTRCYPEIRKRLENGEKVLVVGLPCQIAGVKGYLKKEYENLFLVDLICHGVPPAVYLQEHLRKYSKTGFQKIRFRGKDGFVLALSDGSGQEVYAARARRDEYYYGFLQGLIYRENCYRCQYATIKRVSDITIGDFWGLDKSTLKHDYDGPISVGLINTEKGRILFEQIKDSFICEERPLAEAVAGNDQLKSPMRPDEEDRKIFREYYPRLGYDRAFRKTKAYRQTVRKEKLKYSILRTSAGQKLYRLWKKIKG